MKLFSTRKPRSYHRISIYTDESRDRLQKLVDDVKREQGETPVREENYDTDKFRGTFINYTPRTQRHKESGSKLGWPIIIVIVFGLLVLWRFLLTGIR